MGASIAKIAKKLGFLPQCRIRIVMVGLDGSGKTTILYKLKLGDLLKTKPTIGFNVETIQYKSICFDVWDIGGESKAIVFVVDSSDRERISEARKELHWVLADKELENAAVLVLGNKQDLSDAMSSSEMADKLGLHSLGQRPWYIQKTSACSGYGLYEGLHWLSNNISNIADSCSYNHFPNPFSRPHKIDLTLIEIENVILL
ncbi:hypothetical protein CXB51_035809 [Gossypium anomalum]|uniref:ADP-ribosylation factor n=1 Tax=Gossypium anomalum TaxID=47600 RepID=A0A8J5Y9W2_9ROSI|nr:hypothetical protein CXB51_035809 [Gossypium anomalum]